jgi:hypothetical protein
MKLGLRGGFTWAAVVSIAAAACAADPGDDPKGDGAGAITTPPPGGASSSGSGSSSGGGSGSSSGVTNPPPSGDDASDASTSGGDDGTTPVAEASAPPPPPSCTTCPLTVEYYARAVAKGSISYDVAISNTGSMPQALSDLKLRYWFTAEGGTGFMGHEYYAASPINGNVTWTFTTLTSTSTPPATATADTYMEVAFNATAGSVAAMGSTGDIQLEFNDASYSTTFNQANDYSYSASNATAACATQNNNVLTCQSMAITLYRGTTRVWGVEPGGTAGPAGDP